MPVTESDKEQSARFIETARKLESDESGEAFDQVVAKVLRVTQPIEKAK